MPINISCNNPPPCVVGIPYSHFFSSDTPGTLWFVWDGRYPSGLTLDTFTGELSGTPNTNNWSSPDITYGSKGYTFFLRGISGIDSDDTTCSIVSYLNCLPLIGSVVSLPGGATGFPYVGSVTSTGGIAPVTFAVTSGALPPGLAMDAAGNVTGTPTLNGFYTAFVTVTGTGSPVNNVDTFPIFISIGGIAGADGPQLYFFAFGFLAPLQIECGSPPGGVIGVPYSHVVPIFPGGVAPFTYSISFGALPNGLNLNTASGLISGTPTVLGSFGFTVRVDDSEGATDSVECSIDINPPLAITCGNPPAGIVGTPYSHTLPVAGGVAPYTFALIAGSLPTSLTLDPDTGEIAGTPTVGGTFTFTVGVTDSYTGGPEPNTDEIECSITIAGEGGLTVICNNPPAGKLNVVYAHDFIASGGTPPYTFSIVTGTLPPGLSLGASTGIVSGTPTQSGFYEFTVRVTDSDEGISEVECSITIKACLLVDLT